MSAVSIGKIAKVLGVCAMTIRRWHADGSLLPDFTTKGGHRRYDTNRVKTIFEPIKDERMTIGYCRVSSSDQISDLETQKLVIEREIASKKNSTIICDKGSGINFKKRGLLDLLKRIMAGEVSEVIVTHKDRLVRFGFELIERIAKQFGTKITVLMCEDKEPTFEEELAKDLITIITVFSSRLYGKRSHKNKKLIEAKMS
jgi:predicted site-specific integrase-resolvase